MSEALEYMGLRLIVDKRVPPNSFAVISRKSFSFKPALLPTGPGIWDGFCVDRDALQEEDE